MVKNCYIVEILDSSNDYGQTWTVFDSIEDAAAFVRDYYMNHFTELYDGDENDLYHQVAIDMKTLMSSLPYVEGTIFTYEAKRVDSY